MSERTFTFTVQPPGVPSWWTALADGAWASIAGGAGQRIIDVADPNSGNSVLVGGGGLDKIMSAWTGGCLDPVRKELLLVANGGHDDYYGNEAYALSIYNETPRWYRLCNSTVPADILKNVPTPAPQNYIYADGRPRSVHGWQRCVWANDRAWYTYQDAPGPVGGTGQGVWAFHRAYSGVPTAPGQAAYSARTVAPWESYGMLTDSASSGGSYMAGPAIYDSTTNKILSFTGNANPLEFYAFDVANANSRTRYTGGLQQVMCDGGWAVACSDLRIGVIGNTHPSHYGSGGIAIMSLDALSSSAFTLVNPTGTFTPNTRYGAAYHAASKSILLYDPSVTGNQIVKLKIPTNPNGTYNASGTWTYSTLTPTNSPTIEYLDSSGGWRGTYSKFQIIQDMGDGRSAAVVATKVNGPAWVYKIPQSI
jgi:hypothetical protein